MNATQFAAGQRFATDFAIAQLQPRVTARWSAAAIPEPRRRGAPGTGVEIAESAAAAQQRVRAALGTLGGQLAGIVLDVCGLDRGLEAIETRNGWPVRSGRVALQLALDSLSRHYGMVNPKTRRSAHLSHWGEAGFKPTAAKWRGA